MNINVNFLRQFVFSFFLFLSEHIHSGEKFTIVRYKFKSFSVPRENKKYNRNAL